MFKKVLLFCATLTLPMQAAAVNTPLTAGVFLGSPTSGLTVQYRDDFQFAVGLDTFSLSADAIWNVSDYTQRMQYSPFYTFTGIQWVDDEKHTWGPRAGVGVVIPYHTVHFYAEGGMTLYLQDETSTEFEGSVGVRFNL
ncbi:hypothetical protein MD588_23170 [Photobacterium sp. SDRW27]|uniref:hypothetical protein n=1 Tax=Photobacterium obscurum TaxID=2829490 RepID=UPI002244D20F|nr:hypothetical protein [Photobacterium obscurum]MCW8331705.1 hypothetical protein [Photobacterium obscurum]